jgi:hypothetical protein
LGNPEDRKAEGITIGAVKDRLATPNDVPIKPFALRLNTAERVFGLSRSDWYRRAARGEIELLKCNGRTMVLYDDAVRIVRGLPRLKFVRRQPPADDEDAPEDAGP